MDNDVIPIWFLEPADKEHKVCYFAVCKERPIRKRRGKIRRSINRWIVRRTIYLHRRGNSHPVPTKQTTTSLSKTEQDAPAMPKKKRTRSPSEKGQKKDAPTVPKKQRSTSSLKPASLEDLSLDLVSLMDKLSIAKESTDVVLSSHSGHNTIDLSSGHGSSIEPTGTFGDLVSLMDKLSIAKESTDAVLSSHSGHNTIDVSSGHRSSIEPTGTFGDQVYGIS